MTDRGGTVRIPAAPPANGACTAGGLRLSLLRRAYRFARLKLDPARLDYTDLFLPHWNPQAREFIWSAAEVEGQVAAAAGAREPVYQADRRPDGSVRAPSPRDP